MSIKILLADDSITIQKVVGIIFGGEEYALTVVDNGKAAIEKAKEITPDILLIDALMPGISGYEVCEAIRSIPSLVNAPILILTGSFEPFDEDKAKNCGADDYIAKPFESQQIVNKIKELLEMASKRSGTVPATEPQATPVQAPDEAFAPVIEQPAAPEAVADKADDIWGAFTVDEPPPAAAPEAAETPAGFDADAFSIISEETDTQLGQPTETQPKDGTGTQWIPVDEHTFEFAEETVAEIPAAAMPDEKAEMNSFGEISFEEPAEPQAEHPETAPVIETSVSFTETVIPAFEEEPVMETTPEPAFDMSAMAFEEPAAAFEETSAVAFEAPAAPQFEESPLSEFEPAPEPAVEAPTEPIVETPASQPAAAFAATGAASSAPTLTEEQLKAAIASVSQDVIQRIVWEVVPDLAETLIKEAIRKVKEGI